MMDNDFSDIRAERGNTATLQQRKASDPLHSVWVEASAGTGKTKVLSDRVLRLLLNGIKPSKILCLTYTKAAAVEMSSRIAKRLSMWAVADDNKLAKELTDLLGNVPQNLADFQKLTARARQLFAMLLDTPGGMKIQTIHSFCQEVLKRFPLEAQVSPYFSVMDDRTAAEALDDIQAQMLAQAEQNPESAAGQALAFLTQNVSEAKFPDVMSAIAENRNKIIRLFLKYAHFEDLIDDLAGRLGILATDDADKLETQFWAELNVPLIKEIMNALFQGTKTDVARAETLANVLAKADKKGMFPQYREVFLTKESVVRGATKSAVAACCDLLEKLAGESERVLKLQKQLKALHLFAATKAILMLASELIKGYNHYKNLHSKLDYEDLIVLTRNLLENQDVAQWVMYKLDGGIDAVLIDEAQDTSPDQWAIVKALTEEFFAGIGTDDAVRTVFVVGDRKQSIYSFQGADPEEFERMRQYFKSADENFEEVHLDVSFRSVSAVLDSVNRVFEDAQAKDGVVLENQKVAHLPFRMGEAGKVEIWPLIEPKADENKDEWRPPVEKIPSQSTSSRLAQNIARNIKSMVVNHEILSSRGRPVQYSDFLILVQRRNAFVEELVRACKSEGVEIAGVDKIKLLEQMAVKDLIAVGKFLLLPTDDLTLAEILKSPLWGLNDDDLMKLCIGRGQASLWTRLGDEPAYEKVYQALQNLLNMADFVRPFELYSYILNTMDGRKKFVERMGEEVCDGLDEFVNLTLAFEQDHIPSLQLFIDWVASDEVEIKREQEQGTINAVRIMTVHGSKGLQAPIVVLPDSVRVPKEKKEAAMLWDEMMFFPLSSSDYDEVCTRINEKANQKALQEYRRLLYVALTRAEDRLCICGYKGKSAVKSEAWYDICQRNLQEVLIPDDEGCLILNTQQMRKVESDKQSENKNVNSVPVNMEAWMKTCAAAESPLQKPYSPSKLDEYEEEPSLLSPIEKVSERRYYRGRVIHKLLQFLPDVQAHDLSAIILNFLDKNAPDFSDKEKQRIVEEVSLLLQNDTFAKVFGANSKAEVPLMGEVDGKIVAGQIDRLVVCENEVLIIDFKTNRPAAQKLADVPLAYLKQLKAYQQLCAKIYPDKVIKAFILWTDTAKLMPIF